MLHRLPVPTKLSLPTLSIAALSFGLLGGALAEDQPGGIPQLNSRPGAAYTVYLNVGGFNYDGVYAEEGVAPGFTPALNDKATTGTYDATEQEQIQLLWARAAQSYIGLDVNVTTVDPAVAAGQAGTDAARQAYYNTVPNMMHTVIGSGLRDHDNDSGTPEESWIPGGGADGTSGLNVISGTGSGHTNFMLSEAQAGAGNGGFINGDYIGAVASHENGHAFGLNHQSDFTAGGLAAEYSVGDENAGDGSWVPIMGNASERQRVAWRVGNASGAPGDAQNDVARMLASNSGLSLVDDGIGNSMGAATPLPLSGGDVDHSAAHGVIVPSDPSDPMPGNTTDDWFSFTLDATATISLTSHNSTQLLVGGQADGVGTLRSELLLFDGTGMQLLEGMEAANTLNTSLTTTLDAGSYFAMVGALPAHLQDNTAFLPATYYNMGAFFLTGSGFTTVPEPGTTALVLVGMLFIVRRRRSA